MLDGDGRPFNTTGDGIIILAAGQNISLDAGASDNSNTTLQYSYVLLPADDAAKLDKWTANGIEKAPEPANETDTAEAPPDDALNSTGSRAITFQQMLQQRSRGAHSPDVLQQFRAPPKRAAHVPEAGVKQMGAGWSDRSKVSYTVDAADECLVPVLAIRNNDAVDLLGGSGVLGDTAVALPMQTHCLRQIAFSTPQNNASSTSSATGAAKNSALQGAAVRVGMLMWTPVLAAFWFMIGLTF
jgi:hypothetical protein